MATADEEFSALARALMPALHRRALLLTASHQAAEDLTQTALAKTYAAWWRVRRADDPAAYVHGILLKAFLSEKRRRSSGEIPVADVDSDAAHEHAVADRLALLDALHELSPLDRAVVVLRFWEDRSVEQTAALLDLSSAAVRNRSMRALKRLRHSLEPVTEGA